MIKFFSNGGAVEVKRPFRAMIYAGQSIYFGADGQFLPALMALSTQDGNKITLTFEQGVTAVY